MKKFAQRRETEMVEITAVHPHSRGEKAGIREGDILMLSLIHI